MSRQQSQDQRHSISWACCLFGLGRLRSTPAANIPYCSSRWRYRRGGRHWLPRSPLYIRWLHHLSWRWGCLHLCCCDVELDCASAENSVELDDAATPLLGVVQCFGRFLYSLRASTDSSGSLLRDSGREQPQASASSVGWSEWNVQMVIVIEWTGCQLLAWRSRWPFARNPAAVKHCNC